MVVAWSPCHLWFVQQFKAELVEQQQLLLQSPFDVQAAWDWMVCQIRPSGSELVKALTRTL